MLEPIYKIFAHTVGKDRPDLERFLARNLEIALYPDEYLLNIKTLIKLIMKKYFGSPRCLAQSLIDHVPVPTKGTERIISTHYRGSAGDFLDGAKRGQADGPLLINAVKMYHTKDYKTFYVLGRILSGTIKKNDRLRIMGENYVSGDEEDLFVRNVTKLYLLQGRYRIEVGSVSAGNLVLMEGIDQAVTKTATITHA